MSRAYVAFKLGSPPFGASSRRAEVGAALMGMPKTTLDLDDSAPTGKYEIGAARQPPVVQTVRRPAAQRARRTRISGWVFLARMRAMFSDLVSGRGLGFPGFCFIVERLDGIASICVLDDRFGLIKAQRGDVSEVHRVLHRHNDQHNLSLIRIVPPAKALGSALSASTATARRHRRGGASGRRGRRAWLRADQNSSQRAF